LAGGLTIGQLLGPYRIEEKLDEGWCAADCTCETRQTPRLEYFLSDRDSSRCLWAQRVDGATKISGAGFQLVSHADHAQSDRAAYGRHDRQYLDGELQAAR